MFFSILLCLNLDLTDGIVQLFPTTEEGDVICYKKQRSLLCSVLPVWNYIGYFDFP